MNPNSKTEARVRPLRERLREETIRAILTAAEEVFAKKGVREARVEEIAQRAGVAVGTVYNHFEDREGLLSALLEERRAELAAKVTRATDDAEPFELQLRKFVGTVLDHFHSKREFLAILLEGDGANISRPSQALLELRARGQALVRRGVAQKALRSKRIELFPSMLFGALRASLIYELHNPGKLAVGERTDEVLEFFLHGAGTGQ